MVVIRKLTDIASPDIERASETLTKAFVDDQLTYIVSGSVPGLHAARMRATVITGVMDLVVYVAEDEETGEMLGTLVLKPPGILDRNSANSNGPHADAIEALIPKDPEIAPAYKFLRGHVHEMEERAWGPTGVTDIWFISFVCVLEGARGQGVGRKLCEAAIKETGGDLGLVSISADGTAFYERLGFTTKAYVEFEVRGVLARRWAMSIGHC